MNFADQLALAQDPEFKGRVMMAALAAAINISNETVTIQSQEYHRQRQGLAFGVISNPQSIADRFSFAVAANPAINGQSTDSDIQFTVNTVWNAIAGIPQSQVPTA